MSKKQKKESKPKIVAVDAHPAVDESGAIDWSPIFEAAETTAIWAHEVALATSSLGDRGAVERTFRAVYALIDGRPVERVAAADLLTTVRVLGLAGVNISLR